MDVPPSPCCLFGCSADNISLHLKNIYKGKELDESATAEDFSVVQMEGSREVALALAGDEFEKYRIIHDRRFESDFDPMIKKIESVQIELTQTQTVRTGLRQQMFV